MYSLVILLLLLQFISAELLTKLSVHYTDVHKIKCDALPYRTVYFNRSCYFVIDSESDVTATAKQCIRIFPGSQFTRPSVVPEKVWDSLFVDETSFLSNSASRGKTKAMCVYEIQLPTASTVAPPPTSNTEGKAVCFRKQISTAKQPIDRPIVIDEYHCKLICAERNDCLAFSFANGICSLFGANNGGSTAATSVCGAKNSGCAWVKKTVLSDCPDNIPQPSIDSFGYTQSPALIAGGATPISIANYTFNARDACPPHTPHVIDLVLPDNTHHVQGSYYGGVNWDAKLGAWKFAQNTDDYSPVITYFIRSARCFDVIPSRFSDTSSCGGVLPGFVVSSTGRNAEYKYLSPVQKYGVVGFCNRQFIFNATFRPNSETNYGTGDILMFCIDGTWISHQGYPSRPNRWSAMWTISSGSCADKKAIPSTCPDGGVWSEWTVTGHCATTCGSCSTAARKRTCTKECGDCPCSGVSEDVGPCGITTCPFVNRASFTCCRPMVKCANFRIKKNFCGNGTIVEVPKCRTP